MLETYVDLANNYLAIPVLKGKKTEMEKFPGAVDTFTIEGMMQDKKALQCGTSHFLGQNFAKSCDIKFQDENEQRQYAWTTSWGLTTRLIGAMIMTHSDDDGLVLPPKIAPSHAVILPFLNKEETKQSVLDYCQKLKSDLEAKGIEVILDDRDIRGGEKNWSWVKKGIPLRIEVGQREVESNNVCVARRDKAPKDKQTYSLEQFVESVNSILDDMQSNLLKKAKDFREKNTLRIENEQQLVDFFTPKNKDKPEVHGGFALCHFAENDEIEKKLQDDYSLTVRCIPLDIEEKEGKCFMTGQPTKRQVIIAKAY